LSTTLSWSTRAPILAANASAAVLVGGAFGWAGDLLVDVRLALRDVLGQHSESARRAEGLDGAVGKTNGGEARRDDVGEGGDGRVDVGRGELFDADFEEEG